MNPTTHDRAVPRADAASMQTACDPALDTFVRVLLDRAASPAELDACCDGFYVACAAVTDALSEQRSVLDCGLALSAQDAARCVLGFARTAAYVRALDAYEDPPDRPTKHCSRWDRLTDRAAARESRRRAQGPQAGTKEV